MKQLLFILFISLVSCKEDDQNKDSRYIYLRKEDLKDMFMDVHRFGYTQGYNATDTTYYPKDSIVMRNILNEVVK